VESNGAFSLAEISSHITNAITAFRAISDENLLEDLDRVCARLEELNGNLTSNYEVVDKTLADIEKILDRALVSKWNPQHLKSLEKEVASQLKMYKADMDKDAYRNTFELMLLKRLREEANVPRLSLFYL
jgi:hypothetical protein